MMAAPTRHAHDRISQAKQREIGAWRKSVARIGPVQQRLPLSQRGIREAAFKDHPISAARPRLTIRCRAAG